MLHGPRNGHRVRWQRSRALAGIQSPRPAIPSVQWAVQVSRRCLCRVNRICRFLRVPSDPFEISTSRYRAARSTARSLSRENRVGGHSFVPSDARGLLLLAVLAVGFVTEGVPLIVQLDGALDCRRRFATPAVSGSRAHGSRARRRDEAKASPVLFVLSCVLALLVIATFL
jgi:hypothetical protein